MSRTSVARWQERYLRSLVQGGPVEGALLGDELSQYSESCLASIATSFRASIQRSVKSHYPVFCGLTARRRRLWDCLYSQVSMDTDRGAMIKKIFGVLYSWAERLDSACLYRDLLRVERAVALAQFHQARPRITGRLKIDISRFGIHDSGHLYCMKLASNVMDLYPAIDRISVLQGRGESIYAIYYSRDRQGVMTHRLSKQAADDPCNLLRGELS